MAVKRRKENQDNKKKEDLIKELVDKPYGEEKKKERRSITITLPINIYDNLSKKVYDAKKRGEKGVHISYLIEENLTEYDF
jgi:hypothetical protein